ncbi:TraB/GumN family protein [Parendozoicomonas haliclonae]|uniref:TraB family protein n=1 Tax=Parendozoicomonas haliclonae TaxID=1960125 RepID=A0A1X7AMD2_9GAMM|nr:TraB/GumN family protein [Parendozoicomonas haliclonae]SMA49054.1 TraB family protein [Parendozoicomonas haliclonae]
MHVSSPPNTPREKKAPPHPQPITSAANDYGQGSSPGATPKVATTRTLSTPGLSAGNHDCPPEQLTDCHQALEQLQRNCLQEIKIIQGLRDTRPLMTASQSGHNGCIYLYGSMHFSDEKAFPIPTSVLEKARNSDTLALEIIPEEQKKISLTTPPPAELYGMEWYRCLSDKSRIWYHAYCQLTRLPHDTCKHQRDSDGLLTCIAVAWLTSLGIEGESMDDIMIRHCQHPDGPQLASLEANPTGLALREQVTKSLFLTPEDPTFTSFWNEQMEDLPRLLKAYTTLMACNRQDILNPENAKHSERELDLKRNQNMVDELLALHNKQPNKSIFVLVGGVHLLGESNMLTLLKQHGWTIEISQPGLNALDQ